MGGVYAAKEIWGLGTFAGGIGTYGVEIGVLAGVLDLYDILAGGRPDGGLADMCGGCGGGVGVGVTFLPL